MGGILDILAEHWPKYLSGTWLTIQLVVISAILGSSVSGARWVVVPGLLLLTVVGWNIHVATD